MYAVRYKRHNTAARVCVCGNSNFFVVVSFIHRIATIEAKLMFLSSCQQNMCNMHMALSDMMFSDYKQIVTIFS